MQWHAAIFDLIGLLGIMQTVGLALAYYTTLRGKGFIIGSMSWSYTLQPSSFKFFLSQLQSVSSVSTLAILLCSSVVLIGRHAQLTWSIGDFVINSRLAYLNDSSQSCSLAPNLISFLCVYLLSFFLEVLLLLGNEKYPLDPMDLCFM